jgi:hypothetical protein
MLIPLKMFACASGLASVLCAVGLSGQSVVLQQRLRAELARSKELDLHHSIARLPGLTTAQRQELIALARKEFPPEAETPESARQQTSGIDDQVRVELIDLNGDGVAEVILQPIGSDYCGATGNCGVLIAEKTSGGYRTLLDRPGVQTITVESSNTYGYRDLFLTAHSSASESMIYLYRYHAGKYRHAGCFVADWNPPGKPDVILKSPIITRCSHGAD